MRLLPLDYEGFVRRGVSPPVARFITAKGHPIPHLNIFVKPISEVWEYSVPADATDVIGLWDENADVYVRWTRGGQQEFVQLYHDDPEFTVVAWTEQGLLAELARRYYEFLDWNDEVVCRKQFEAFTEYIGFRHSAALESYMAVDSDTTDFFAEFRSLFGRLL
mgnify:CR=1 FL=1